MDIKPISASSFTQTMISKNLIFSGPAAPWISFGCQTRAITPCIFVFSPQLHGYMENKPLGLQIFIGTADERILKPHAFYQVHRITGKTVTTTSYEKIVGNTKVLEIPLEPKNNMRAT